MEQAEDIDDDQDFNDQIDLSSDDDHALASIRKEKHLADIRDSEVSEANELKIHESCSDLNIVMNNQSQIVTKVDINDQVVEITTQFFEEVDLRQTLVECLQQQNINYLTAAYYLTKKHEFEL